MNISAKTAAVLTDCKRAADTTWRLSCGGLVGRQALSSFQNFSQSHAGQSQVLEACQGFANRAVLDAPRGLWLIGPPGTGKTHLGSAIVSHMRKAGSNARIHCVREVLRILRATRLCGSLPLGVAPDFAPCSEKDLVNLLGAAELLVLDNIGVSVFTGDERDQFFDIIDLRCKHGLPTVLISNLNVPWIRAVLGDESFSRLREGTRVLVCNWPSARGVNRAPQP